MEVTLLDLRTELRLALYDSGANPKADDDTLNMCIADAVTLWSGQLPYMRTSTITVSGQNYLYPDNCVKVFRIWGAFTDASQETWVLRSTAADWRQAGTPVCFIPNYPQEGYYYLPTTPLANFTLLWGERLEAPTADGDIVDLENRVWGKQAIRFLAGYYAFFSNATFRSRIEQWETRLDRGVGNPFAEEAQRWLDEYNRLLQTYAQGTGMDF